MKNEKRYLYLSDAEWRVLLLALNMMRSKLIAQGRYTGVTRAYKRADLPRYTAITRLPLTSQSGTAWRRPFSASYLASARLTPGSMGLL